MLRDTERVVPRWSGSVLVLVGLALLAGCATAPLEVPDRAPDPVAPRAVTDAMLPLADQLWGGVIARVDNRSEATVIEVLGYPLRAQEPQTGRPNLGRFRLWVDGFADPVDYRAGRRITALGEVTGIEDGRIGERAYAFPVLEASSVYLWPEPGADRRDAGRVRFGIGIGIGL